MIRPRPYEQEAQKNASGKGEIAMLKRVGVLALFLSATGAVLLPATAFAQDGYSNRRDYYYQGDRDRDRHEAREWRERERRERRAEEQRDRAWRRQEWREHEWREGSRWQNGFYPRYAPDASYYYSCPR